MGELAFARGSWAVSVRLARSGSSRDFFFVRSERWTGTLLGGGDDDGKYRDIEVHSEWY